MSDIERTTIWPEVKKVINSGQNPVRFLYTGRIHTVDNDIDVMKIISIDIVRDYVDTIFDYTHIEFIMPLGDYIRNIYPYRANLEFSLFKKSLTEVGTGQLENTKIDTIRFKAVFMPENKSYKIGEYDRFTITELNTMDIVTVTLQLLDRNIEAIRLLTVNGIYKNTDMRSMLKGVLIGEAQRVLVDGKPALTGADIIEPSNTTKYPQIVIPNNQKLTNIPFYLQENSYGIYAGGLGSYFQNYNENNKKGIYWFIYPIFDESRYNSNTTKLIIYSVPATKLTGIERTYRTDSNTIYILATARKLYWDSGQADYMDDGVGFTMTDANAMMKKPVKMTEDGPIAVSNRLNYKVGLVDREDGFNAAFTADRKISANPFAQYARVLQRAGGKIDIVWQNSNPDLIYPGMPIKYYYLEEEVLKSHDGVVSYNHNYIQTETNQIYDNSHITSTHLSLYIW